MRTREFMVSFLNLLARPAVVFYTLLWLMVLLVAGTVAQRYVGLYPAQQTFFYSVIWWIGPLPTPGGLTTLGILTAGLAARTFVKGKWSRAQIGTQLTHLGALLLLLGGLLTFATARDGSITLFPGEQTHHFQAYADGDDRAGQPVTSDQRYPLPFAVELVSFDKTMHPGTNIAKSYASTVIIHEPDGTAWRAHIEMNVPLRYRGFTLYQSSYLQSGDRVASVLAVVQNAGRMVPYIASMVMAVGILLHLGLRIRRYHGMAILVAIFSFATMPAIAGDLPMDLNGFAHIPVQDQGRIKPIDTFARSYLETFSGRDHTNNQSAVEWLATVLFMPDCAADTPIFRIQSTAVRDALGLVTIPGNRFSFRVVTAALTRTTNIWMPLLAKPIDTLSLPQKQLIELVENVDAYAELTHTFNLLRPDIQITNAHLAKILNIDLGSSLSIIDIRARNDAFNIAIGKLIQSAKHKNPHAVMNENDRALLDLGRIVAEREERPAVELFRVIPHDSTWSTPTTALNVTPVSVAIMPWQQIIDAYSRHDDALFKTATKAIQAQDQFPSFRLNLEVLFNRLHLFGASTILYLFAAALALVTLIKPVVPYARQCIWLVLTSAIVLHLTGILARMVITGRPPVTNLYDSILFVGLIAVVLFTLFARRGSLALLLMAAVTGAILQSIGLAFDAEGDTMRVLTAVLDTNFWLSTHVVMVTTGYGTAIVAAMIAHAILVTNVFHVFRPAGLTHEPHPLLSVLHTTIIIALFATATGTILGGIWADQSWGRFWGWDPKENGALLIVLWIVWVLHGRLSGHLRGPGFIAACAALNVIVASAWFGVNLLGVGLHSYGFTASAMTGFVLFCTADVILITTLTAILIWRERLLPHV